MTAVLQQEPEYGGSIRSAESWKDILGVWGCLGPLPSPGEVMGKKGCVSSSLCRSTCTHIIYRYIRHSLHGIEKRCIIPSDHPPNRNAFYQQHPNTTRLYSLERCYSQMETPYLRFLTWRILLSLNKETKIHNHTHNVACAYACGVQGYHYPHLVIVSTSRSSPV